MVWLLPPFSPGPRESASVVMANDQQGSLPDKAAFRQLRKKDLDELAVKYELAPSPGLDKTGLQTFLKENLDLEEYWQELKDQATYEREAVKQQDSEREEAQRQREETQCQERTEKRQQDIEKEERLSKDNWAKRDHEAKKTAKTRDHINM